MKYRCQGVNRFGNNQVAVNANGTVDNQVRKKLYKLESLWEKIQNLWMETFPWAHSLPDDTTK
jgi:hypothetical protein